MAAETLVVFTKILWLTGTAFTLSLLVSWMRISGFAALERFLVLCLILGFSCGAMLLGLGALPWLARHSTALVLPMLGVSLLLILFASIRLISLLRDLE